MKMENEEVIDLLSSSDDDDDGDKMGEETREASLLEKGNKASDEQRSNNSKYVDEASQKQPKRDRVVKQKTQDPAEEKKGNHHNIAVESSSDSAYLQHLAEICYTILYDLRWNGSNVPPLSSSQNDETNTKKTAVSPSPLFACEYGDDMSLVVTLSKFYKDVLPSSDSTIEEEEDVSERKRDISRSMLLFCRLYHRKGPWFRLDDLFSRYYYDRPSKQEEVTSESSAISLSHTATAAAMEEYYEKVQEQLHNFLSDIYTLQSMGFIHSFSGEEECAKCVGENSGHNNNRNILLTQEEQSTLLQDLGGNKKKTKNKKQSVKTTTPPPKKRRNEILHQMKSQRSIASYFVVKSSNKSSTNSSPSSSSSALLSPVTQRVNDLIVKKWITKCPYILYEDYNYHQYQQQERAREIGSRKQQEWMTSKTKDQQAKQNRIRNKMKHKVQQIWQSLDIANDNSNDKFNSCLPMCIRICQAPLQTLHRFCRLFLIGCAGPERMRNGPWLSCLLSSSPSSSDTHNSDDRYLPATITTKTGGPTLSSWNDTFLYPGLLHRFKMVDYTFSSNHSFLSHCSYSSADAGLDTTITKDFLDKVSVFSPYYHDDGGGNTGQSDHNNSSCCGRKEEFVKWENSVETRALLDYLLAYNDYIHWDEKRKLRIANRKRRQRQKRKEEEEGYDGEEESDTNVDDDDDIITLMDVSSQPQQHYFNFMVDYDPLDLNSRQGRLEYIETCLSLSFHDIPTPSSVLSLWYQTVLNQLKFIILDTHETIVSKIISCIIEDREEGKKCDDEADHSDNDDEDFEEQSPKKKKKKVTKKKKKFKINKAERSILNVSVLCTLICFAHFSLLFVDMLSTSDNDDNNNNISEKLNRCIEAEINNEATLPLNGNNTNTDTCYNDSHTSSSSSSTTTFRAKKYISSFLMRPWLKSFQWQAVLMLVIWDSIQIMEKIGHQYTYEMALFQLQVLIYGSHHHHSEQAQNTRLSLLFEISVSHDATHSPKSSCYPIILNFQKQVQSCVDQLHDDNNIHNDNKRSSSNNDNTIDQIPINATNSQTSQYSFEHGECHLGKNSQNIQTATYPTSVNNTTKYTAASVNINGFVQSLISRRRRGKALERYFINSFTHLYYQQDEHKIQRIIQEEGTKGSIPFSTLRNLARRKARISNSISRSKNKKDKTRRSSASGKRKKDTIENDKEEVEDQEITNRPFCRNRLRDILQGVHNVEMKELKLRLDNDDIINPSDIEIKKKDDDEKKEQEKDKHYHLYKDWSPITDITIANAIQRYGDENGDNPVPRRCSYIGSDDFMNDQNDEDEDDTTNVTKSTMISNKTTSTKHTTRSSSITNRSLNVEELAMEEYASGRLYNSSHPIDNSTVFLDTLDNNGGDDEKVNYCGEPFRVGWHDEGGHIRALFRILCMDKILKYNNFTNKGDANTVTPSSSSSCEDWTIFLTKYQSAPLDLHIAHSYIGPFDHTDIITPKYDITNNDKSFNNNNDHKNADTIEYFKLSRSFYERRRHIIEAFCQDLENKTDQELCQMIYESIQERVASSSSSSSSLSENKVENTISSVVPTTSQSQPRPQYVHSTTSDSVETTDRFLNNDVKELRTLSMIASGFGGKALAGIFRCLCFDYRHYCGGMPDLLLVKATSHSTSSNGDEDVTSVPLKDWIGEAFQSESENRAASQLAKILLDRDDEFLGCDKSSEVSNSSMFSSSSSRKSTARNENKKVKDEESRNDDNDSKATANTSSNVGGLVMGDMLNMTYEGNIVKVQCMLVEVKSHNDRLSERQEDWLNILNYFMGRNTRVCKFIQNNRKRKSKTKMKA